VFWAVSALGAVAVACMAVWVPHTKRNEVVKQVSQFKALARPQVLLALALSILICAGAFSVWTYIAPLLLEITGISPTIVPLYLSLFGLSVFAGMQVGGRFPDAHRNAWIIAAFPALVAIYLIQLIAFADARAAALIVMVWGFAFSSPATAIQLR